MTSHLLWVGSDIRVRSEIARKENGLRLCLVYVIICYTVIRCLFLFYLASVRSESGAINVASRRDESFVMVR